MNVKINKKGVENALTALSATPRNLKRATVKAVNDTVKRVHGRTSRELQQKMGLKTLRDARKAMKQQRATIANMSGSIFAEASRGKHGFGTPLVRFKGVSATNDGVKATIMGKSKFIRHGFKSKKLGNHYFRRVRGSGPSGLHPRKIYELTGPSVASAMAEPQQARKSRADIDTTYNERLRYWVNRYDK